MRIPVYSYRIWTHDRAAYVIKECMATRQFIQKAGGEIYENSERMVDESRVTPEGEEIVDSKPNKDNTPLSDDWQRRKRTAA